MEAGRSLGVPAPLPRDEDSFLGVWLTPVSLLAALPAAAGLLTMREQRKRRKEKLGEVHSLQPLGVSFLTSQARTEGLLMQQPVPQIPFPPVSG